MTAPSDIAATRSAVSSSIRFFSTLGLLALALFMGAEVFVHFNPGALSPDSLNILAQARSGIFEDGEPPLLAAIWRQVDHAVPGPVGILLMNLVLFYGGLFLIFRRAAARHPVAVLPAFLIVGLFPPIIGILGAIWVDVTMAGFLILAIGIFVTLRARPERLPRIAAMVGALSFAGLAIAVRHNGAAAAFPLIALFLFLAAGNQFHPALRLVLAVIGGIITTVLFFLSTYEISARSVSIERQFWRVAAIYDIAGASWHDDAYLFYPDVMPDNSLDDVHKLYSPRSVMPLLFGEQVHALPGHPIEKARAFTLSPSSPGLDQRLASNWIDVITHHPTAYLTHRFEVFASLATRSPWGLWAPIFDMIYPNDLGIAERLVKDSAYFAYVKGLAFRSAVFVPLLYLLLSAIAVIPTLALGLRLQNETLLIAAALFGSGVAHMVGLFFFAPSADFRYSHWMITTTVVATSLVLLEIARALWRWCRRRCADWICPSS